MHDNVRRAPRTEGEYRKASRPKDYRTDHDRDGSAKLTTTLVHALADVMGRDVTEAGSLLYESVDPEAVNSIFSTTDDGTERDPGHIAFAVDGYRVTVYSDGDIVITPPEQRTR
jgi:hypothetical protein